MAGTGSEESNVIKFPNLNSGAWDSGSVSLNTISKGSVAIYQSVAASAESNLSLSDVINANNDTAISKLFLLLTSIRNTILNCISHMEDNDLLSADNDLMVLRRDSIEILMFRSVSDSVTLLGLRIFQALKKLDNPVDGVESLRAILKSVNAMHAAPHMDFQKACSLADEIEAKVGQLKLVGYDELSSALISFQKDEKI